MKTRLLSFLACPECANAPLALDAFVHEGDEVLEGVLSCADCARRYPVIAGVPRLLPDALLAALAQYHPDFFRRYQLPLPGQHEHDAVARTLTFYSFARAKLFTPQVGPALHAYWQHSLRTRIPEVAGFRGQIGLDAGCGEGRYTYCLAEAGAEIIGLDLSEAVTLAYRRNRDHPRAHIVQGSIYQPPFRRSSLAFVMSTGVLHHLPNPRRGFEALVPLLHPGGSMHIWVYGLRQMSRVYALSHLTAPRRWTSRLPPQASYLLSIPIALALHWAAFKPLQLLARHPAVAGRINPQLRELAALPFQMHLAEVLDRLGVPITHYLTEAEVHAWYTQAGFEEIIVAQTAGGRGWSARGRLPALVDERLR